MRTALLMLALAAGGRDGDEGPANPVSVFAISRGDVWAAGRVGEVLHFDGKSWSKLALPVKKHFGAVWASGPSDVWLGGAGGLILRREGSSWKTVASPTKSELRLAWGSGPSDIWFAALDGTLVHWDGKTASLVDPGVRTMWSSISGTGPNDVWLVGPKTRVVHYDGKRWATAHPEFPGKPPGIQDVLKNCWFWSVWAKSPGEATALLVLANGTNVTSMVMRFTGSTWTMEAELESTLLTAVWGKGPVRYATGSLMAPERESRGGGDWKPMPRKAKDLFCDALVSLHGTGPSDIWAMSRSGQCVSHWDGLEWANQALP